MSQKYLRIICLMTLSNILNTLESVSAGFLQTFDDSESQRYELNKNRPIITWPDNFEISISTNEFALNVTEKVYFDKRSQKVRLQLFYSVMGLDSSKGFDLVLDEKNQTVAVQSDEECKKTDFMQSLLPINLFFGMFNQLTDYMGINEEGLHTFQIKQFNENIDSIRFFFYFDENLAYVKSSLSQASIGKVSVDVVQPMTQRSFEPNDWYTTECQQIESAILKSGNGWASFMHQLVSHLLLNGEDIQSFIGLDKLLKTGDDEDDEEF